jgi:hypothetical protein
LTVGGETASHQRRQCEEKDCTLHDRPPEDGRVSGDPGANKGMEHLRDKNAVLQKKHAGKKYRAIRGQATTTGAAEQMSTEAD